VEWTINDVGQSAIEFGSTSRLLVGPIRFMSVWMNIHFLSTFYVLCSSQVCSDCANVAMNGKVKAIRHKIQCLLCSEVSECVNFTSMSETPTRYAYSITKLYLYC